MDPSVEAVVKALEVLAGSRIPLFTSLDVPFVFGWLDSWLWPLCRAGLPQGSASGKSRESFLIARAFGGETDAGAAMGVIGRWGDLAASSDTPEKAADVIDRLGSFGTGKSAALLVLASGSQYEKSTDFFVSRRRYRE